VTVKDGTAVTPLSTTVQFDQGDVSISGLMDKLRDVQAIEANGVFIDLRHTTRTYPSGSVTGYVSELSESGTSTVMDMIHATSGSAYAARVSTRTLGDVITFDITFAVEGTDYGGVDGTITLEDCRITWDYSQSDVDTVSFSFTCYGAISGDLAIAEG